MSHTKAHRNRKSTAGIRRVNHGWLEEEIISLITSVEAVRGLWDFGSDEYRLTNRKKGWESVAHELNIDGVDAKEAKTKWLSLRTSFMTNLTNIRNEGKSPYNIKWKFFGLMSFLESTHSQKPRLSTPKLVLESPVSWDSNQSSAAVKVKREDMKSPTPPPSNPLNPLNPSPLSFIADSGEQIMTVVNHSNAVEPVQLSADSNAIFCDYLLNELRTLPEKKARTLRNKLGRVMFEYMDECSSTE